MDQFKIYPKGEGPQAMRFSALIRRAEKNPDNPVDPVEMIIGLSD
jgi:hypothetical protein